MGSLGSTGETFFADLAQSDSYHVSFALFGGLVFNIANIFIVAAIAIAGMAVAFPIGIGIALVEGTILNYALSPVGNLFVLFIGVLFVLAAIILDAKAYAKIPSAGGGASKKGIITSIIGGLLMGLFYPLMVHSMDGDAGLGPYGAVFILNIGILISNFPLNYIFMKKPVSGPPMNIGQYFKGTARMHLLGLLGGAIWCTGTTFNIVASETAGPAIAYAFGQNGTMIAILWGLFVWKEFKDAPSANRLLTFMFICFLLGILFIGYAKMA